MIFHIAYLKLGLKYFDVDIPVDYNQRNKLTIVLFVWDSLKTALIIVLFASAADASTQQQQSALALTGNSADEECWFCCTAFAVCASFVSRPICAKKVKLDGGVNRL